MEPSKLQLWQWLQPKPGAGDLAIKSSKLEFWPWLSQSLERVTLPSSLQSLSCALSWPMCLTSIFKKMKYQNNIMF
jgi:hypothetical protein